MNREEIEHLDDLERERIAIGLANGESCRAIGRVLGRSASTVSRERRRNGVESGYVGGDAQRLAIGRAQVARRPCKLRPVVDNWLRGVVLAQMRCRRSPEQIAADLKRRYPHEPERWVSHQTICTEIGILPRGKLKRELPSLLRQKGKPQQTPAEAAAPREWIHQLIHDRSTVVEGRTIPDDFEGDLLIGKAKYPAAVDVLRERS